jgi:uroporphyrinogen-III synthase
MSTSEYDIIIIGSGPSSAGLLRDIGILSRLKRKEAKNTRIAVVGGGTRWRLSRYFGNRAGAKSTFARLVHCGSLLVAF